MLSTLNAGLDMLARSNGVGSDVDGNVCVCVCLTKLNFKIYKLMEHNLHKFNAIKCR